MGLKKIVIVIFIIFLLSSVAFSIDLFSINSQQVKVNYPEIKLYMNILDDNDKPIDDLSIYDYEMTATLNGKEAKIQEITPFNKVDEGIGYLFLIDISRSLTNNEFDNVKQLLNSMITDLKAKDTASIVTFGEEVNLIQDFTNDKKILETVINEISLTDDKTRFYDGIKKALEISKNEDSSLPERRVIIAITDGREDYDGGITKEELLKDIEVDNIPIYAIGVYHGSKTDEKQKYLDIMGEIARASNGMYYQIDNYTFDEVENNIYNLLIKSQVVKINCEDFIPDGEEYKLNISLKNGSRTLSSSSKVILTGTIIEIPDENPDEKPIENPDEKPNENPDEKPNENPDEKPNEKPDDNKEKQPENENNKSTIKKFINVLKDNIIMIYILVLLIVLILIILIYVKKYKKNEKDDKDNNDDNDNDGDNEDSEDNDDNNIEKKLSERYKKFRSNYSNIKDRKIKQLKLTAIDTKNKQKDYIVNIGAKVIIGRSKDCDLYFKDIELSRKHCAITCENNILYIEDLNSTNGTIVNGVPIKGKYKLSDKDIILIGQLELRVSIDME